MPGIACPSPRLLSYKRNAITMESTIGYHMSVGTAMAAEFGVSGDGMRMQETEEEKFREMDRQLIWDEAERYELEIEREAEIHRLMGKISAGYLAAIGELL